MKHRLGLLICLLVMTVCVIAFADVEINETNFPDENFRAVVREYDTDDNGIFTDDEIKRVTFLFCNSKNISSIKGVEYFDSLKSLNCGNNQLNSIDVSANRELTFFDCSDNNLSTIDLSRNPMLETFRCINNRLTSIDLTHNPVLKTLSCDNNNITTLDVSQNSVLEMLYCGDNELTNIDVSKNIELRNLGCYGNQITSIDVCNNRELVQLWISGMKIENLDLSKTEKIETLDCSKTNLHNIDVSNCRNLKSLRCHDNNLEVLDLSNCKNIESLHCQNNNISQLDLCNCKQLTDLRCDSNRISSMDIRGCDNLQYVFCNYNELTTLELGNCTELETVECRENALINLNVSASEKLKILYCGDNQLTSLDIRNCKDLEKLTCTHNKLTELDISQNVALSILQCSNNQLSSLNPENNIELQWIHCSNNNISSLDISHNTKLKELDITGNSISYLDIRNNPLLELGVSKIKVEKGSKYFGGSKRIYTNGESFYFQFSMDPEVQLVTNQGIIQTAYVEKITINSDEHSLTRNMNQTAPTLQLEASVIPDYATIKAVKWSSSNKKVAQVDENGLVTGLKAGTAIITCAATDGSKVTQSFEIMVNDAAVENMSFDITNITLTRTSKDLKPTEKMNLMIEPTDALNQNVKWASSDKKTVMVDQNGNIKGLKPGKATITCALKSNASVKAECVVTVVDKQVKKIRLEKKKATVDQWKNIQLKIKKIEPADAINQKVTWSSSDRDIASVDSSGNVKGKKKGSCVITCSIGKVTATCKVTVK